MSVLYAINGGEVLPATQLDFTKNYYETDLQSWADKNPALLNAGTPMLSLGMEIPTTHGHSIDNLFLDANDTLVVAELKRGKSPRDITAQVIDYGAFVDKLSWDDVDLLCQKRHSQGLDEAFSNLFGTGLDRGNKPEVRMLLVAQTMDPAVIDAANYIIGLGVPLALLEFTHLKTAADDLIEVETVYGEIPSQRIGRAPSQTPSPTHELGYDAWIFDHIVGRIEEIASSEGWPLVSAIKKASMSFTNTDWPPRTSALQFTISTWTPGTIKFWLNANEALVPGIREYLINTKSDWYPNFAAEDQGSTRNPDVIAYALEIERPTIGNASQLNHALEFLENMTMELVPRLNIFFTSQDKDRTLNHAPSPN